MRADWPVKFLVLVCALRNDKICNKHKFVLTWIRGGVIHVSTICIPEPVQGTGKKLWKCSKTTFSWQSNHWGYAPMIRLSKMLFTNIFTICLPEPWTGSGKQIVLTWITPPLIHVSTNLCLLQILSFRRAQTKTTKLYRSISNNWLLISVVFM